MLNRGSTCCSKQLSNKRGEPKEMGDQRGRTWCLLTLLHGEAGQVLRFSCRFTHHNGNCAKNTYLRAPPSLHIQPPATKQT